MGIARGLQAPRGGAEDDGRYGRASQYPQALGDQQVTLGSLAGMLPGQQWPGVVYRASDKSRPWQRDALGNARLPRGRPRRGGGADRASALAGAVPKRTASETAPATSPNLLRRGGEEAMGREAPQLCP
jgi:hypothetical protein